MTKPSILKCAIAAASLLTFPALLFAQEEKEKTAIAKKKSTFAFSDSHFELVAGVSDTRLNESLGYLTGRAHTKGCFVELRQYPFARRRELPAWAFFKFRLAYNDWGNQQVVGLISKDESSKAKQMAATIGGGAFILGNSIQGGLYFAVAAGISRWSIKTTYPSLANLQFAAFGGDAFLGFEYWGFFVEVGGGPIMTGKRISNRLNKNDIDYSRHEHNGRNILNYDWVQTSSGSYVSSIGYKYKF
jgi:hypothetical protein